MKTLDQVGSLLGSLQGNKILQKLTKKKDDGFYKNEIEFKRALKQNLIDIASAGDQPLYVPTPMIPGIAYSDFFNSNIEDIVLDLEVLFDEINYIFSKIKSHEIFFDRSVTEAEVLIKKLEQAVESAKVEGSPENAFNKIFHNTFTDASNKVDFSNREAKEFYYDFQIKKRISIENLCPISTVESKISLPKTKGVNVPVAEAKVLTTESTVSDYEISFPDNKISNLLNPLSKSSWDYPLLVKKQLKDAAKLVIGLDLGDIKEFNSITVNSNSSDPVYLEEIYILDSNGSKINLEIEPGFLIETKNFLIPKTLSKSIYFSFKQYKNKAIPYNPSQSITLAELQRDPALPLNLNSLGNQIGESIKDPSIKNILGLQNGSSPSLLPVYYYNFSVSSIVIGNDNFKNKGMYVSKPEEFKKIRNLGFYSKDFIPKAKHWQTDIEILAGSIEYVLFKKDYDTRDRLIKTSVINILPVGTSKIENEKLHFETSRVATLRFLGHKTNGDGSNLKIYRNGELLIRGLDWKFVNHQGSQDSFFIDPNETETKIELMHSNDQVYNGLYYAEYVPRFILEPDNVIIDNGIRFLENCSVVTPEVIYGQEIATSDIYVQIIIRNHTEISLLSPYVDYYRLAGKEE